MVGTQSLAPSESRRNTSIIRPYKITEYVLTRFGEAARRYASEKRRAAFFTSTKALSKSIKTDSNGATSKVSNTSLLNQNANKWKFKVSNVASCPTNEDVENVLNDGVNSMTHNSSKVKRDSFVASLATSQSSQPGSIIQTKVVHSSLGVCYNTPKSSRSTAFASRGQVQNARPLFKNLKKPLSFQEEKIPSSRTVSEEEDWVTLEEASPRPAYHLYRINIDGTSELLPVTVEGSSQVKNKSFDLINKTSSQGVNLDRVSHDTIDPAYSGCLQSSRMQSVISDESSVPSQSSRRPDHQNKTHDTSASFELKNRNPVHPLLEKSLIFKDHRNDDNNSNTESVPMSVQISEDEQECIIISSDSSNERTENTDQSLHFKVVDKNLVIHDISDDDSLPDLVEFLNESSSRTKSTSTNTDSFIAQETSGETEQHCTKKCDSAQQDSDACYSSKSISTQCNFTEQREIEECKSHDILEEHFGVVNTEVTIDDIQAYKVATLNDTDSETSTILYDERNEHICNKQISGDSTQCEEYDRVNFDLLNLSADDMIGHTEDKLEMEVDKSDKTEQKLGITLRDVDKSRIKNFAAVTETEKENVCDNRDNVAVDEDDVNKYIGNASDFKDDVNMSNAANIATITMKDIDNNNIKNPVLATDSEKENACGCRASVDVGDSASKHIGYFSSLEKDINVNNMTNISSVTDSQNDTNVCDIKDHAVSKEAGVMLQNLVSNIIGLQTSFISSTSENNLPEPFIRNDSGITFPAICNMNRANEGFADDAVVVAATIIAFENQEHGDEKENQKALVSSSELITSNDVTVPQSLVNNPYIPEFEGQFTSDVNSENDKFKGNLQALEGNNENALAGQQLHEPYITRSGNSPITHDIRSIVNNVDVNEGDTDEITIVLKSQDATVSKTEYPVEDYVVIHLGQSPCVYSQSLTQFTQSINAHVHEEDSVKETPAPDTCQVERKIEESVVDSFAVDTENFSNSLYMGNMITRIDMHMCQSYSADCTTQSQDILNCDSLMPEKNSCVIENEEHTLPLVDCLSKVSSKTKDSDDANFHDNVSQNCTVWMEEKPKENTSSSENTEHVKTISQKADTELIQVTQKSDEDLCDSSKNRERESSERVNNENAGQKDFASFETSITVMENKKYVLSVASKSSDCKNLDKQNTFSQISIVYAKILDSFGSFLTETKRIVFDNDINSIKSNVTACIVKSVPSHIDYEEGNILEKELDNAIKEETISLVLSNKDTVVKSDPRQIDNEGNALEKELDNAIKEEIISVLSEKETVKHEISVQHDIVCEENKGIEYSVIREDMKAERNEIVDIPSTNNCSKEDDFIAITNENAAVTKAQSEIPQSEEPHVTEMLHENKCNNILETDGPHHETDKCELEYAEVIGDESFGESLRKERQKHIINELKKDLELMGKRRLAQRCMKKRQKISVSSMSEADINKAMPVDQDETLEAGNVKATMSIAKEPTKPLLNLFKGSFDDLMRRVFQKVEHLKSMRALSSYDGNYPKEKNPERSANAGNNGNLESKKLHRDLNSENLTRQPVNQVCPRDYASVMENFLQSCKEGETNLDSSPKQEVISPHIVTDSALNNTEACNTKELVYDINNTATGIQQDYFSQSDLLTDEIRSDSIKKLAVVVKTSCGDEVPSDAMLYSPTVGGVECTQIKTSPSEPDEKYVHLYKPLSQNDAHSSNIIPEDQELEILMKKMNEQCYISERNSSGFENSCADKEHTRLKLHLVSHETQEHHDSVSKKVLNVFRDIATVPSFDVTGGSIASDQKAVEDTSKSVLAVDDIHDQSRPDSGQSKENLFSPFSTEAIITDDRSQQCYENVEIKNSSSDNCLKRKTDTSDLHDECKDTGKENKKSKTAKHTMIQVPLNEVYKYALKLILNFGNSLLLRLKQLGPSPMDTCVNLLSLPSYITRFLLHQAVRVKKVALKSVPVNGGGLILELGVEGWMTFLTLCGWLKPVLLAERLLHLPLNYSPESDRYKILLTIHGLVKAMELLIHYGLEPACKSLKEFCAAHQIINANCYDGILSDMNNMKAGNETTHPKVNIIREELARTRPQSRKIKSETDIKVLVVCENHSEAVFDQLKKGLGDAAVCLLTGIPSYQTVLQLLEKHSVLVWRECQGVNKLPCSLFTLVVEWDQASSHNSLSCISHYLRQNITVVSLSTAVQKKRKDKQEKEDKETGGDEEQVSGDGSDNFTFVASQKIISHAELHYVLTSKYNITLVERCLGELVDGESVIRGWPDIVVDERTCILVHLLADLKMETNIDAIKKQLILISLQATACFLVLYHDPSSVEGYAFRTRVITALTRLMSTCIKLKSSDYRVCILYACDIEQLGELVRCVGESARKNSISFDKTEWNKRSYLTPKMSTHERILLALPCLNPISAQIILTALTFRQLLTLPLASLLDALPWIPSKVVTNMYNLLHGAKRTGPLTNPSNLDIAKETPRDIPLEAYEMNRRNENSLQGDTTQGSTLLLSPYEYLAAVKMIEGNQDQNIPLQCVQETQSQDPILEQYQQQPTENLSLQQQHPDYFQISQASQQAGHLQQFKYQTENPPHMLSSNMTQQQVLSESSGQNNTVPFVVSPYFDQNAHCTYPESISSSLVTHNQNAYPQQAELPVGSVGNFPSVSQNSVGINQLQGRFDAAKAGTSRNLIDTRRSSQVLPRTGSEFLSQSSEGFYEYGIYAEGLANRAFSHVPGSGMIDPVGEYVQGQTVIAAEQTGNQPISDQKLYGSTAGAFVRQPVQGRLHQTQRSACSNASLPVSQNRLGIARPYHQDGIQAMVIPPSPRVTLRQDGRGHDYPNHYLCSSNQVGRTLGYAKIPGKGGQTRLVFQPRKNCRPKTSFSSQSEICKPQNANQRLTYRKIKGSKQTKLSLQ